MSEITDAARKAYDEDRIATWVAEGGLKKLLDEHETLENHNEYFRSVPNLFFYQQALDMKVRVDQILAMHVPVEVYNNLDEEYLTICDACHEITGGDACRTTQILRGEA